MKWLILVGLLWLAWQFWRPKRAASPNDAAQARALLGVSPGADADAIRAAHRRLIAEAHPDRGGSTDLTRRLNAARDLLISRGG